MEEVRKEEVEGMKMVAVVDDMDFMIGGGNRKEVEERMRKMERGLRRGLEKWEVDVQTMKLEAMWMGKDRNEGDKFEDSSESVGSVVSE
ncbi:hypothetical protein C7212DRAFT_303919 [Tuber magnatum]|uniref:Uncharacterized protein n=1 Tax=Tuber magnatum TaxID=42249 RepID=A0A317SXB9_9PEZI|nr:hypothetical protein C7212DRAFT_303919 [Tuber magnatum]